MRDQVLLGGLAKVAVVALVMGVLASVPVSAQATGLFDLAKTGTPQAVQAAIAKGADPMARDPKGLTPLMIAAASNPDPAVIGVLLKAGADPRALEPTFGQNALMLAAGTNNPKVVAALLTTVLDPNAQDYTGQTAVELAASTNPDPGVITALVKAGANVRIRGKSDYSPILMASSGNNASVMLALLGAGANPNDGGIYGGAVLLNAVSTNPNPGVIIVLLKAGADAKADFGRTDIGTHLFAIDAARDNPNLKGTDALWMLEEASK
jgi:ankyrin repeat protein